jgi:hypothetical protein
MTVLETKQRIEKELSEVVESFGAASSLVKYSIEVEVTISKAQRRISPTYSALFP